MAVKPVESYEDLLYQLQNYKDENQFSYPRLQKLVPPEDAIYNVDLNTRTIDSPQFLSVQYDHNAEVIYFKCARYFENVDLTTMACMIEYINAAGDAGVYWVPFYDVYHYEKDENNPSHLIPYILIPWAIEGLATLVAGKIQYTIKFFELRKDVDANENIIYRYNYSMSTRPAVSEILFGMDLSDEDIEIFKLDYGNVEVIGEKLKESVSEAATYWLDV